MMLWYCTWGHLAHLLKQLDLDFISIDKNLHCHILYTILDAFEDLHHNQSLPSPLASIVIGHQKD